MPVTEFPPPIFLDPAEVVPFLQPSDMPEAHARPAGPAESHAGTTALHGAEVALDPAYIEQGLAQMDAYRNEDNVSADAAAAVRDQDIRPEDAGRVQDIEAAHKEALETEILNAHAEALAEDERRAEQQRQAEAEAEEAKANAEADENAELAAKRAKQEQEAAADKSAAQPGEAAAAQPVGLRQQAEAALKAAGQGESIPATSAVITDPLRGNMLIVAGKDVRVLEKKPGGGVKVTEYDFNETSDTLTIKSNGRENVFGVQAEYVPSQREQGEGRHAEPDAITLPPPVARIVGFKQAVPRHD